MQTTLVAIGALRVIIVIFFFFIVPVDMYIHGLYKISLIVRDT